jgi:hypothetical protein
MSGDPMDNRPIDFLIVMHGDISKTHSLLELLGQEFRDDTGEG